MNRPVTVDPANAVPAPAVSVSAAGVPAASAGPVWAVLGSISVSHLLNDTMQSLIPSVYPILKQNYALDFAQVGLITLVFQVTASLLQPVIGMATDRRPMPFSLSAGMGATFAGLLLISAAHSFWTVLLAAALIGLGSAVFHPEAARIARLASGGRFGTAQSIFQVGGSLGTAIGPVLAALIVVPFGQQSLAWFSGLAFIAVLILWRIGRWYRPRIVPRTVRQTRAAGPNFSTARTAGVLAVLIVLVFSKYFYMSSIHSYYTFYLMQRFGVSTQTAQLLLFLFLGSVAAGTLLGGPIGDRIGRRHVIWFSILGALPFTLALPHVGLVASAILTVPIGFIMASAMPAIIVYAQELMPHRFGMISGLFFGFAFGAGGIGAAIFGEVADRHGIEFVYAICAFLPAMGLLALLLPDLRRRAA